ncbi:glutamate/leucine/phenylalanine/valine dehydrogenase [Aulographum hederae CBS 113979]|uniref:NAD-specific glutamate dehydrogenase n=1 Tax=Aulographum hederae CBS 113979 TaxID=1176131 RepID=A0A6G1GYG9_9PEZI|nr:glutamate/leucine/phenylalanine/valine dehydrogenase [Aulographum hederae CBS 113979]
MASAVQNGLVNKQLNLEDDPQSRHPSPQPTHLSVPGRPNPRILHEKDSGYVAPKFEGKEKQMEEVMDLVDEQGFIPEALVEAETKWFYYDLGIDDMFFATESAEAIMSHILTLYAGKVASYVHNIGTPRAEKEEGDASYVIRLDREAEDHAVYIDTSVPGAMAPDGPNYELRLERKYLDHAGKTCYRVETFRSDTTLPRSKDQKLRCYFVYQCDFANPNPQPGETRLEEIGEKRFLQKATKNTKEIYSAVLERAVTRTGPVIEYFDIEGSRDKRLVLAFKRGSAEGLFSAMSDLYHSYGLTSSRKYVEQFSNGYTVMSLYLREVHPNSSRHPPIEAAIFQILKETSLLYCLPKNKLQDHFVKGRLTLQETIYGHCVFIFLNHFLNRLGPEYKALASLLDSSVSSNADLLSSLKRRLRNETFTADYILEILNRYPDLIHSLYLSFANTHYVQTRGETDDFIPTLSYLRITVEKPLNDAELKDLIVKRANDENDRLVMDYFRIFNQSCLKTNFYTPTKVALSFRLHPAFLPLEEYPQPLYGMFLVVSSESRGFHLRFRDIARGGIRIVKSPNPEAYAINARSLFDENYNLANTQQRKNKDIPEGGSKGVILLDVNQESKAAGAFEKYIDSIMDLLLPPTSPGIKDPIVDLHGKEEILFMGPDENTANLVDWATEHARNRGAPWWKSFFTGKSQKYGGIPHDMYGMTTLSVREYVLGIYDKLKLDPSTIRKFQTGGPDGDLGSNEILQSNEKYIAISDGAGVLLDPEGLDHEELVRLAKKRVMINEYDISKLSPKGFRVLVSENNVELPNGETVRSGMTFRNTFYLRTDYKYDMFVPCGGRPASIDLRTVGQLISNKKALIPFIVEGANLFITEDARLRLEEAGCVLYKDASVNKGGVTSSSMEVLASLAFDDAGFLEHMCVKDDGTVPQFYQEYVQQVQKVIKNNARLEFAAIWKEFEETGVPRSVLSDKLSNAITKLDEELQRTNLWHNEELRKSVLDDALPNLLLDKIGLDTILGRVPENYLRAIFGSYLASRFVYKFGPSASQFAFFDFMNERMASFRK